jgi:hypothetical protein
MKEWTDGMTDLGLQQAQALMQAFAQRTGITSDDAPRRYLWTDAFAVCNFLGLARATGEQRFIELALRLADQTHHTLGQHRADDPRSGWISGLGRDEGEAHPTRGGLRIGKALPERRSDEPFDERLEWERDGQYFHYLTKWMHALDQLSRATREPRFALWARELAVTAARAFVYRPPLTAPPRMYWKMSIDLSHPLVSSMGQHDPLDGCVTVMQLLANRAGLADDALNKELEQAARTFSSMLKGTALASSDPLGIGGLLTDAYRIAQLKRQGAFRDEGLLERLLKAALEGLRAYTRAGELQAPAQYRLAFRELGLAIGITAAQRLSHQVAQERTDLSVEARQRLAELDRHANLCSTIAQFWSQPAQQRGASWLEHRDINEVMLATTLLPGGFLELDLTG